MTDEAEKLINLSLCKMATSRTIRRGNSLHKHLLISTVLTKARSAYFETWFRDGEVMESKSGRSIDLNSSYQELDFPLDDEEDDDLIVSEQNQEPESRLKLTENGVAASDNNTFDPRFFVETVDSESEIELPSDILNCIAVQNMRDISDMNFTESACTPPTSPTAIQDDDSPSIVGSANIDHRLQNASPSERIYFDLDSLQCTNRGNNSDSALENEKIVFVPKSTSTPHLSKRRRSWGQDDQISDDDDDDDEKLYEQSPNLRQTDPKRNKSISITNIAKRLKFSEEPKSNGDHKVTSKPFPTILDGEFRTKKSHFEEDEQEDSDDDPFLGDTIGQGQDQITPRHKNDQRVPSTSSGSSSSDEDTDESMEVDQITNLVQFISFHKHPTKSPLQLISSVNSASGPGANRWPAVFS